MTDTLISLISIFIGLISANIYGYFKKKIALGFIGNTISGIFGSILFIKIFGRLGFGPKEIMDSGTTNLLLFSINIIASILGGILGLVLARTFKNKMERNPKKK